MCDCLALFRVFYYGECLGCYTGGNNKNEGFSLHLRKRLSTKLEFTSKVNLSLARGVQHWDYS